MPLTRGTAVQSTGQLTWVINQPHFYITFPIFDVTFGTKTKSQMNTVLMK